MTVTAQLAERIAGLRWSDLPPEAFHWAKMGILDTIGVTVAGAGEPCARITARVAGADRIAGSSLVFGGSTRTDALTAALVNGTASHALDFDDISNTFGGHPSAVVLPAVIALGEELGSSGRDVLLAYIAGFETETCIAHGVHFHHYQKGWHPTSTLGVFGAAAACAKLMGLDARQTETALAVAASFASGIKANFGSHTKPLHVGHATRDGLFAALLAREGFTAGADAFEHPHGFLMVYNGEGTFDAEKIVQSWGNPYDIVEPGIAIKQYPACGSTHPALDAMLAIVREHAPDPRDVKHVEAFLHRRRLAHTNRPDPRTPLEGKFSLQYVLARALTEGKVTLEHFEGDAIDDDALIALMRKIDVAPYSEAQFAASNHFGGEVTVVMNDGRTFTKKVDQAIGRTSSDPLPRELLIAKFDACVRRGMPDADVDALASTIENLENVATIRELTSMLATSRQPVEAA